MAEKEPPNDVWVHQAHFEWRQEQLAALDGDGHLVGMFPSPHLFVYKRGRRVVLVNLEEARLAFNHTK